MWNVVRNDNANIPTTKQQERRRCQRQQQQGQQKTTTRTPARSYRSLCLAHGPHHLLVGTGAYLLMSSRWPRLSYSCMFVRLSANVWHSCLLCFSLIPQRCYTRMPSPGVTTLLNFKRVNVNTGDANTKKYHVTYLYPSTILTLKYELNAIVHHATTQQHPQTTMQTKA